MKRILFAAFTAGFLGTPAMAADMPLKAPVRAPAEVVAYNWTGFYVGAHVGGGWGNKDQIQVTGAANTPANIPYGSYDVSGWLAGGQVGFNWQSGRLVFGIEAQASWTNADGARVILDASDTETRAELKSLGTIAARVGYTWDRTLLYLKGGAAWVKEDYSLSIISPPLLVGVASETRWGWMAGAGAELAVWSNWSVKLEYNYMDFGNRRVPFTFVAFSPGNPLGDVYTEQHMHVVKAGINYRFGALAPVVARY